MTRLPAVQAWDRTHAPPPGAAGDGLAQGHAYSGIIQSSTPSNGMVPVIIPALHMSQTFMSRVAENATVAAGQVCLVLIDEQKVPWIVSGAKPGAPPLVSALPASPVDGQEIYFQSESMGGTTGSIWHLRYRAASASAFKWEFVGGGPLFSEVEGGVSTASTTYVSLGLTNPALKLPLAGDYDIEIGAYVIQPEAVAEVFMSYSIGATAASDTNAVKLSQFNAGTPRSSSSVARARRLTGLGIEELVAKYRTTAGTATYQLRWMKAIPFRVG